MRVDLFDFDLPKELVALRPVRPRDNARMLHVPASGAFADLIVRDLPSLLNKGDVLVFNDTRVIPAQLHGYRDGSEVGISVTLHKRVGPRTWNAFVKKAKRLKDGDRINFSQAVTALVQCRNSDGSLSIYFEGVEPVETLLEIAGSMPLPPYIAAKRDPDQEDLKDYQTVFANKDGAVAAPTAGLHFTERLLDALGSAGILRENLTLHVGAGTFLPVKVEDTNQHKMHSEWGKISSSSADRLNTVRNNGGRIIAVGTTSLRLIETSVNEHGVITPFEGETDIFITPGYKFKGVDGLMTNFHLPRSTLMMLVSALIGRERILSAYEHAIANNYRFYSYGDCSLLLP